MCFLKLILFSALSAQTKIHTNIPRILKVNQPQDFKLAVVGNGKGTIAVYELKASTDLEVLCGKIKNARVLTVGNGIRIEFLPSKSITIETAPLNFTVNATAKGTCTLSHSVYYLNEPEAVTHEFNPSIIKVVDAREPADTHAGYTTINENNYEGVVSDTKIMYSDPAAMKQHLLQLYSDSREINAVGETELTKANSKLENSNLEIRLVEYLNDDHTRKKITGYILVDRKKAIEDIQLARNIILVGKSLEMDADSYRSWAQAQQDSWKKEDRLLVTEFNPLGRERVEENAQEKETLSLATNESVSYRIQLGAFKKHRPSKARFSSLGSVDIIKEDGWYKVLIGNYKSKEEALIYRESAVTNGFDAFVAAYQKGRRLL